MWRRDESGKHGVRTRARCTDELRPKSLTPRAIPTVSPGNGESCRICPDLMLYLGAGDTPELHLADGNLRKGPVFENMRWPQFLPGGERLVYAVYDTSIAAEPWR